MHRLLLVAALLGVAFCAPTPSEHLDLLSDLLELDIPDRSEDLVEPISETERSEPLIPEDTPDEIQERTEPDDEDFGSLATEADLDAQGVDGLVELKAFMKQRLEEAEEHVKEDKETHDAKAKDQNAKQGTYDQDLSKKNEVNDKYTAAKAEADENFENCVDELATRKKEAGVVRMIMSKLTELIGTGADEATTTAEVQKTAALSAALLSALQTGDAPSDPDTDTAKTLTDIASGRAHAETGQIKKLLEDLLKKLEDESCLKKSEEEKKALEPLEDALDKATDALTKSTRALDEAKKLAEVALKGYNDALAELQALTDAFNKQLAAAEQFPGLQKSHKKLTNLAKKLTKNNERLQEELEELKKECTYEEHTKGFRGTKGPEIKGYTQCFGWANDGKTKAESYEYIREQCGGFDDLVIAGSRAGESRVIEFRASLPKQFRAYLPAKFPSGKVQNGMYYHHFNFDMAGKYSLLLSAPWVLLTKKGNKWADPGRLWEPGVPSAVHGAAATASYGHVLSEYGNQRHDQSGKTGDTYYIYGRKSGEDRSSFRYGPQIKGYTQCYAFSNTGHEVGPTWDNFRASCGNFNDLVFAGYRPGSDKLVEHKASLPKPFKEYLPEKFPSGHYASTGFYYSRRDFDMDEKYSLMLSAPWVLLATRTNRWRDPGRLWEPAMKSSTANVGTSATYGHVLSQDGNNRHDVSGQTGDEYFVYGRTVTGDGREDFDYYPKLSGYERCYTYDNDGESLGPTYDEFKKSCGDFDSLVFAGRRAGDKTLVKFTADLPKPLKSYLPNKMPKGRGYYGHYYTKRNFDMGSKYSMQLSAPWFLLAKKDNMWSDPGRLWEPCMPSSSGSCSRGATAGHVLSQKGNQAHDQHKVLGDEYFVFGKKSGKDHSSFDFYPTIKGYKRCYTYDNDGNSIGPDYNSIRSKCGHATDIIFAGYRPGDRNTLIKFHAKLSKKFINFLPATFPRSMTRFRNFDTAGKYSWQMSAPWLLLATKSNNWRDPGRLWEPCVKSSTAGCSYGATYGHVLSASGNNRHDVSSKLGDEYFIYVKA